MIESGNDKLRELLNNTFTPQKQFTDKNIKFDLPEQSSDENRNTSVIVKGVPGKGYYGAVEVHYNRVDLSLLSSDIEIHKEGQLTLEEICVALNSMQNAAISVEDLLPVTIPLLEPGDSFQLLLEANPTSMGWTNSKYITITYGKPSLPSVLGNTRLGVLVPPGGHYDYPSAWALLYYQDFTSIRDSLLIHPSTRGYIDGRAVQEITNKLGIPGWTLETPRDYSTSEVPDSNQDFDRVIVQTYIGSNDMYGPIYFHYNTTKFDGG